MKTYKFNCGCEVLIENESPKEIDGLPSLSIDFDNLRLDCPDVWELIKSGRTKGIFQLETQLGQTWAQKVEPESIEELSALISLLRPGVLKAKVGDSTMAELYVKRKRGEKELEYLHPALESILKETMAILLYQEEVLNIVKYIFGFNLNEADVLRKCILGGSLVYSSKGLIPIEENPPDILTIKDNLLVYVPIKRTWKSGTCYTWEISTYSGCKVAATWLHQIYTQRGWITISQLKTKDRIMTCNPEPRWERVLSKVKLKNKYPVYDFELEEEPHCGFVGGILIHNSIGKKDAKLMAQVEKDAKEKAKEHGVVNEEEAGTIFSWIKEGQMYLFNKCLAPQTIVSTPKSTTTIFDINIGDQILAPNLTSFKDEYVPVINKYQQGQQQVYEVKTESGNTIYCTLNHKFLCEDMKVRPLWRILYKNHKIMCEDE